VIYLVCIVLHLAWEVSVLVH